MNSHERLVNRTKPTTVNVDQMTASSRLIYESAEAMRQAAGQVEGVFAAHQRWLENFLQLAKGAIDERLDRLERIMVHGGHEQHTAVICAACGKTPAYTCPNRGHYTGCGVPVVITLDPSTPR